jgi:integrase
MDATLKAIRSDVSVHGMRSTFRVWVAECTSYPHELGEFALAHRIADATARAYQRSDMVEKRREMMQAWADYCARRPGDNVVKLVTAAA